MRKYIRYISLAQAAVLSLGLNATELPYLGDGDLKSIPPLEEAYTSTSPEDLGDGIEVGTLDAPGAEAAVKAFLADDKADKYENLDSLLIWKDGKLIFEMYNRKGRVDAPHYMMSVTKTMTSVVLARAMQLGFLSVDDLDKPVIDFMPEIDRTKIQKGVDTITLRDVLFMKSGLRFKVKHFDRKAKGEKLAYFQQIFENTEPVTPESKTYKYTGLNPSIIHMIIDIKTGGVQDFIKKEFGEKMGANYRWADSHGLPMGGAGSKFTSRFLIKCGVAVLNGGKHEGKQWLSADYVKLITDTNKGNGFFYYFHNRQVFGSEKTNFISGNGAGAQYMSVYPHDNIVISATSSGSDMRSPLRAIEAHFVDILMKK